MKRCNIDPCWSQVLPIYQEGAVTGRLPFYRDWSTPVVDAERGVALGGLSVLWVCDPWLDRFTLTPTDPSEEPIGWWIIWAGDEQAKALSCYRTTERQPDLTPAPEPLSLARGLGYAFEMGGQLKEHNKRLMLPASPDVVDLLGEASRLIVHREWANRGQTGYLGAECAFAMIAAELRLDLTNLQVQAGLKAELSGLTQNVAINTSLDAVAFAATLIEEGLGEAQAAQFRVRLKEPGSVSDPLDEEAPTSAVQEFFLGGEVPR